MEERGAVLCNKKMIERGHLVLKGGGRGSLGSENRRGYYFISF